MEMMASDDPGNDPEFGKLRSVCLFSFQVLFSCANHLVEQAWNRCEHKTIKKQKTIKKIQNKDTIMALIPGNSG